MEEATTAGVALACLGGVGIVEGVDIPVAVVGEVGGGVGAVGDQVPEVFGGGDVAGVVAGHADDDDGVIGVVAECGGGRYGDGGCCRSGELVVQVGGEGVGGGVVEN